MNKTYSNHKIIFNMIKISFKINFKIQNVKKNKKNFDVVIKNRICNLELNSIKQKFRRNIKIKKLFCSKYLKMICLKN